MREKYHNSRFSSTDIEALFSLTDTNWLVADYLKDELAVVIWRVTTAVYTTDAVSVWYTDDSLELSFVQTTHQDNIDSSRYPIHCHNVD